MFKTLINSFKNKDVRKKILITLALVFLFRLGTWIPIPGLNENIFRTDWIGDNNMLFGLMSAITGGALAQGAILAVGVAPYINASIIMQLLTVAIPPLEQLSKQGEEGRKKITKITHILTLILAAAQGIGIVLTMRNAGGLNAELLSADNALGWNHTLSQWLIGSAVVIILMAGASFTMWIGERITEKGVSNGISILIFVGIIASIGQALIVTVSRIATTGGQEANNALIELIGFLVMVVLVFALIVFIDLGERRVPIQYAKQVKGRKMYGGQSTHIPIKINPSGVLPIIFAMALITFPQLVAQLFFPPDNAFLLFYNRYLGVGRWPYFLVSGILIFFFSYFYAGIQFNPEEVSRNIQQYGGFIPGIRPGKPTGEYLGRISKRLTLFGAAFLTFIVIVPGVIFGLVLTESPMLVTAFSATGLLIVVSVALEFDKSLESQLMMKQYKGFLK
ncbi:MAG: preprotein translocase subunit SecY [Firmicutes bacterium]|nr:preprotein translocase subunit SecY [Bacillota bacterium]